MNKMPTKAPIIITIYNASIMKSNKFDVKVIQKK